MAMADVNAFIEAIGKDVNATVVPRIDGVAEQIGTRVKEIVDEQSVVVRDFVSTLIQDLFQRYRPDFAGELRTKIVPDGIELHGEGIKLDLKRRDTGALVSSLDIPISIKIRVDGLALNIQETTIRLDVIR
jgi:hypothetical protein